MRMTVDDLLIEARGMPSSAVHTFTDPDDYAAAIRQGTYELTVTQRGDFTAKFVGERPAFLQVKDEH